MFDREWLAQQKAAGRSDADIAKEAGIETPMVGYYRRRLKIPACGRSERAKAAHKAKFPDGRYGPLAGNWQGGRTATGSGYWRIYKPEHPHANHAGYVYEHRLVMEQKIGRLLKPGEIVDHIDRNRGNNAPENLRLHESRSQHVKDHFSARDQLMKAEAEIERLKGILRVLLSISEVRNAEDMGPEGEGWQSPELSRAIGEAEEAIGTVSSTS